MHKLRDLIYNTSDILVTLLIILVALILISWRVSSIMDYGTEEQTAAGNPQSSTTEQTEKLTENAADDTADVSDTSTETETAALQKKDTGADPSEFKITVRPNETSEEIVSDLYADGLISDQAAFLASIRTMQAETKLKAGTYTIPAGSSPEDIIDILIS